MLLVISERVIDILSDIKVKLIFDIKEDTSFCAVCKYFRYVLTWYAMVYVVNLAILIGFQVGPIRNPLDTKPKIFTIFS